MPRIGLQLSSINKELIDNPKDILAQIAYMGFAGLETPYTFNGLTLNDYSKILKKSGLEILAIHSELPVDDRRKKGILERAKIFKSNRIIWHGLPEDPAYRSEEGIIQLAQRYNRANQFVRSNGLTFGLHNHWWEFEKLSNGTLPFDILQELLDPDIFWELDVYWIAVAGQNPVEIIERAGSRAKIIQVKDGPAVWTPELDEPFPYPVEAVGTGSLDYPAIFRACTGKADWIVVDIEACRTDIIQAIFESYRYIVNNKFGTGLE